MTERELYLRKARPILERFAELGIEITIPPENAEQTFAVCPSCQGKGGREERNKVIILRPTGREIVEETTKIHCSQCGGSGYAVTNSLFEWGRKLHGMINGGS